MFNRLKVIRNIKKSNQELLNKIYACKEEFNKWSDIPLSWQLDKIGRIWFGKEVYMNLEFAQHMQLCNNVEEFAKSLSEWKVDLLEERDVSRKIRDGKKTHYICNGNKAVIECKCGNQWEECGEPCKKCVKNN